ncbi:MAG: beta-N-acetylhexosaminidase [Alistipes sp.]|nr:beta-N-acetylhexosaminidase [Alistipes sp.]
MKKLLFLLCAFALAEPAAGAGPETSIVPRPASITTGGGTFTVNTATVIGTGSDKELRRVAALFAESVAPALGGRMKCADRGAVALSTDDTLAAEEYRLEITPSGVAVCGGTAQGVFYGLQSLRQLVVNGGGVLPVATVCDKPFFEHRGGMLDSGRHFWTTEQVKEFIDILALHKMNRFHWHLTEDQGWRIEIRKYPELTRTGSVRRETLVGHGSNSTEYDGTPCGGYYTRREIREIVRYAAERFVTVIPEIELPGHAVAALASYPWLGCRGEGYEVRTRWGGSAEVYCPGKETTFRFLEDLFTEVLELFPSEYIHIGGDECPKTSWKSCPLCQQRIREEGLKDEYELQSYTVRRMEQWLRARGRRIIGWDEILEGGVSPTATVMSWRGSEGGIAAAKAGNRVIMTPNDHCYLDYYQTKNPVLEPQGIGGCVPMSKAYALDPYDRLSPDERPYILGVQANLWTEYIATPVHLKHMLLPRLAAIAEVAWAYDRRDFEDFRHRMEALRKCYDTAGYNYATYFFDGCDE